MATQYAPNATIAIHAIANHARHTLFTMKTNGVLVPHFTLPITALLRLEALVALAATLVAYRVTGGSWPALIALFLLPDISMVGYFHNARTGAFLYNAVHNYFTSASIAGAVWVVGGIAPSPLWLIWFADIAFDRLLGYGLKFPDAFRHTHLNT